MRGVRAEARKGTWRRCILGLEEANNTLAMQAPRAQKHSLGVPTAPADHREAVLAVTAGHALQGVVLDALGNDQQPWVAVESRDFVRATPSPCPCAHLRDSDSKERGV